MKSTGDPAAALACALDRVPLAGGLWVGFSGGVDSTALLWLAKAAARERKLHLGAVHVNHGLHPDADVWTSHCQDLCERLEIPLTVLGPEAGVGKSETEARQYRYALLERWLGREEVLMLAHHRDDQAETLLLNLLRGSGLDGLAGMPTLRALGAGWVLRPLLSVTRQALEAVAARAGLDWIEDPSNAEVDRPRNALRHEILPSLRERWPAVDQALARAAGHLGQARIALESTLDTDVARLQGADPSTLALSGWLALPGCRRPLVIRHWLTGLGLPCPDHRQLGELVAQLSTANEDRHPLTAWPGARIRRFRDRLYASGADPVAPDDVALAFTEFELTLPEGLGRLCWHPCGADTGHRPPPLTVRFRRGGERIRLPGRDHHSTLKNLFNRAAIPPWERNRIPLLYEGSELVAVADLWPGHRWSMLEAECGHRLCWERG